MRRKLGALATLVILVLSLGGSGFIAEGKMPNIDQAEAIAASRVFLSGFRVIPDSKPAADVVIQRRTGKGLWSVEYPNESITKIDQETGEIVTYVRLPNSRPGASLPSPLTDSDARKRAGEYLAKAGVPEGVDEREAVLQKGLADRDIWSVLWVREIRGVEVYQNAVRVNVDANTGELLLLGKAIWTQEPAEWTVNVHEPRATEIAREHLGQVGLRLGPQSSGKLMIVEPNFYWTSRFVLTPIKESRLAWVLRIEKQDHGLAEIWVDAADGSILGGGQTK